MYTLNSIRIFLTSCYITIKTRKMSYVLCNPWFNSPFKWCDIPYFPSLVNRKITVFVLKKPEVLHSHLGHYPRHLSTSMSTNAFYFIVVPTNIVIWIFLSIYLPLYHFPFLDFLFPNLRNIFLSLHCYELSSNFHCATLCFSYQIGASNYIQNIVQ